MKGHNFFLVFFTTTCVFANVTCCNVTENETSLEKTSHVQPSQDEVLSSAGILDPINQPNLIAPDQNKLTLAQWTEWFQGPCYSGCIQKSKGARTSRRSCQIPQPALPTFNCQGPSTDVQICDDFVSCAAEPVLPSYYASEMCKHYQNTASRLMSDLTGKGKQADHNPQKVEQACTIYCKTRIGVWYSPHMELSSFPDVDLYFPDGTWCHNDGNDDFFCLEQQCRSASSRSGPIGQGVNFLHNARPDGTNIPDNIKDYFTLDEDDQPKSNDKSVFENGFVSEEEFEQLDGLSISDLKKLKNKNKNKI